MPFYVINSSNSINNTVASGDGLQLGLGDNALIQATGSVLATGSNGTGIYVNGYAEESTVIVDGLVYGTRDGIYSLGQYAVIRVNGHVMGDSVGVSIANGGYLYVGATGMLSGFEGLSLQGSNVINDGTINGTGNDAMQMSSGWLVNNGLISSRFDSIFYGGDGAGSIDNTGTIQGSLTTWYNASAATAKLTIDNSGRWIGSLGLTPGDDTVTNTGTIDGSVYLGNGTNSLDSRYGLITGSVSGGSGIDTIRLGAGDTLIEGGGGGDTIEGGAGIDTASYQSSVKGVSVNLVTGTASGGDAQGDHLSGIENLYGSLNRDILAGDNGDNLLNGVLGRDALNGNGGNDTIIMLGTGTGGIDGGDGNDLIQLTTYDSATYGYAFTAAMKVNGGSGFDTLELTRAPTMTFTSQTVRNIERLVVNDGFNYNFTSIDVTVASGARMAVDGGALTGNKWLTFDGSAETNGAFDFTGGNGSDTFTGGTGADTFTGGARGDTMTGGTGADTFIFTESADSRFPGRDTIADFDTATDTLQFDVAVTAVEAAVSGSVSTASDLQTLANGHLGAGHAVLINVTGGTLAGHKLLLVDANGTSNFQANADYCIDVTGLTGTLTVADFII